SASRMRFRRILPFAPGCHRAFRSERRNSLIFLRFDEMTAIAPKLAGSGRLRAISRRTLGFSVSCPPLILPCGNHGTPPTRRYCRTREFPSSLTGRPGARRMPRRYRPLWVRPGSRLEVAGTDDLVAPHRDKCGEGANAYPLAEEVDRAVGKDGVHAAY